MAHAAGSFGRHWRFLAGDGLRDELGVGEVGDSGQEVDLKSSNDLLGRLMPPVAGAFRLAALVASCFLGAIPFTLMRAVCLVLAMFAVWNSLRCPASKYSTGRLLTRGF